MKTQSCGLFPGANPPHVPRKGEETELPVLPEISNMRFAAHAGTERIAL